MSNGLGTNLFVISRYAENVGKEKLIMDEGRKGMSERVFKQTEEPLEAS